MTIGTTSDLADSVIYRIVWDMDQDGGLIVKRLITMADLQASASPQSRPDVPEPRWVALAFAGLCVVSGLTYIGAATVLRWLWEALL